MMHRSRAVRHARAGHRRQGEQRISWQKAKESAAFPNNRSAYWPIRADDPAILAAPSGEIGTRVRVLGQDPIRLLRSSAKLAVACFLLAVGCSLYGTVGGVPNTFVSAAFAGLLGLVFFTISLLVENQLARLYWDFHDREQPK